VIVVLVGAGALTIIVIALYNGIVGARQRVREAWGAVDVQLQRRASLIPNLVETVKGAAAFERGTLQTVVAARSALTAAGGPREAARANDELGRALGSLFAVAEAYPQLKATENFRAAADGALRHRGQDRLRAQLLQRQRRDLQHQGADGAGRARREPRPIRAGGILHRRRGSIDGSRRTDGFEEVTRSG